MNIPVADTLQQLLPPQGKHLQMSSAKGSEQMNGKKMNKRYNQKKTVRDIFLTQFHTRTNLEFSSRK